MVNSKGSAVLEKESDKKQEIDEQLMASLERVHPIDSHELFPSSKGRKSNVKATLKQPELPPVTPAAPIPVIHTSLEETRTLSPSPKKPLDPTQSKRHLLLFVPALLTISLTLIAVISRFSRTSLLPKDTEAGIYFLLAIINIGTCVALVLYYLGELRERYVLSASNTPVVTKDVFTVAICLLCWPVLIAIISIAFFFAFLGDEASLGTMTGLSTTFLLTGPLTIALGVILILILSIYKKTTIVPYPPYVHQVIDFVWHKLR